MSQMDVLLVGPRVAHLKPHFEARGYSCDAFVDGGTAMMALEAKRRDLVVVEINLGEMTAAEFVERAKLSEPSAAYLLLDDPSRAGQIVKCLQAGVTHYLPTPPDEERLFREAGRLVQFARHLSGTLVGEHERALQETRALVHRANEEASKAAMQSELVALELEAKKRELADKQLALDDKLAEKQKELDEALARPTREEYDEIFADREELRDEVRSLKRRLDEMTAQEVKSAGKLSEMDSLEQRLKKLEEERPLLEGRAAAAEEERDALKKSADAELGTRSDELARAREQLGVLEKDKAAADEKAIDLELQVDELTTKIAFFEEQAAKGEERVQEIEARYKKERLRLIEEKQHAAAGSHEAWQKMEKLVNELAALKAAKSAAEGKLKELEQKLGS